MLLLVMFNEANLFMGIGNIILIFDALFLQVQVELFVYIFSLLIWTKFGHIRFPFILYSI
jgi:hypothetical protein